MWQPDYATIQELKHFQNNAYDADTDPHDQAVDLEYQLAITAASRSIDRASNRQFGTIRLAGSSGSSTTPEARIYTAVKNNKNGRIMVSVDDVYDATDMTVFVDWTHDQTFTTPITFFRMYPFNALANGRPYTHLVCNTVLSGNYASLYAPTVVPLGEGAVQVTSAYWGWSAVPPTIHLACLLQASRLHMRRNAPFGISGSPQEQGELRLLAKLDPDVAVMVGDFLRMWTIA